jgi:hypothetical protein
VHIKKSSYGWCVFFLGLGLILAGASAHARTPVRGVEARVFRSFEDRTLLFRYHREEVSILAAGGQGETLFIRALSTNADGTPAVTESYESQPAAGPGAPAHETYRFTQHQTGEWGVIERVGAKVSYRLTRADGTQKEAQEDSTDDWAVGTVLVRKLQLGWARILKGESVNVRIAVPERLESFGFAFQADPSTLPPARDARGVRVWLTPRSFLVRLVVKPIEFWMVPDGSAAKGFTGRTLLKARKGASWDDLIAYTEFEVSGSGP